MISAAGIKVYSFLNISRVVDLYMEVKKGRHGRAVLRGYVSGGCDVKVLEDEPIKITVKNDDETTEEILFQGVIQSAHLFCENGVNQVILSALTHDIKLDKKENSRSFQDISSTYTEIMKSVAGNNGGEILYDQISVKTGYPVVQYKETDWQFCRRMASGMGQAVFCNPVSAYPQIEVGLAEKKENVHFSTSEYKVCVDEEYYRLRKEGDGKREFLYYQVESEKNYEIGSSTRYQGQKRYIFEKTAKLQKGVLVFQYKLGGKCRFAERKFYNGKISGAALSGSVEKTDKESIYLKLDIDGEAAKAAYAYPWAPVTGNFMYCMPKIGTKAYLYFADSDERNARAVNSIRTNASYTGFSNAQNRTFVTEDGKQMKLYPDRLSFEGGKEGAEQKWIMETDDMLFRSKTGKMQIIGKEKIVLKAPEISLAAVQKIGQYKMATYAQQKQSEVYPRGSGNPATGGGGDGASELENGYNALAEQGILRGTVYELYRPFEDEPEYSEYKEPLPTWVKVLAGAAIAVVVGLAIGALVVATGGLAAAALGVTALQLGAFAGAVTAGAGIAASVATGINDGKNGTESSVGEYLSNSFSASAKVGASLAVLFAAPYAAEAMTYSVMLPYSSVNILGATVTTGNVLTMANIFAVGTTFVNLMFQVDDVSMFVKGQKELGEPTGNQYYDYAKKDFEILAYNIGMFAAANPRMYGDAKDTYRQIGQDMGIRGNSDKRIGEIKVEFSYNSKYDKTEFERQLAEQEEGMNKLTVQEYLDNRQKYIEQGRSIESNAAQQAAREKAFLDKVDELQNTGLSLKEAEKQAQKWIDTQAALHNPDQIAGGRASSIGGVGDKAINSSIGSQWRYRINDVDEQIKKMIENMSEAERKSTYLNVNLVRKGG